MSVRLTRVPPGPRSLPERLGDFLAPRPSSTFLFRLETGEILVVDRSLPPEAGCLAVVGRETGGMACRRLEKGFSPSSFWGRVTWIIKTP